MKHVPVAISCLANAMIGGKRYEMLSSRSYRCNWFLMMAILDTVFGENHCRDCYRFEVENFDGIQD